MTDTQPRASNFGKWMALAAALLGWLFDGLEMGLFPLVARPALEELLPQEEVGRWIGVITALFLVGAATGGVLFGWLGDRIGRVRSMMLSVLTYAVVSGLCGFATEAWQIGALRFVASLGMGGEWSLGVALINEVWPDRSRAFLAGLIGAAANVGYLLIAVVGRGLESVRTDLGDWLIRVGLPEDWVMSLTANNGWRLLMMFGAAPALLTFLIRIFVPESARWERERDRGATSHWANRDLVGVLVGSMGACGIIFLWAEDRNLIVQIAGSLVGLTVAILGYIYPVVCYLERAKHTITDPAYRGRQTLNRMLLAACLSGVALLGTWGSVQQAPPYAYDLVDRAEEINHVAKEQKKQLAQTAASGTQFWSALGAVFGTIVAALIADWLGRRVTYSLLCLGSLIIIPCFFLISPVVDTRFFVLAFIMGGVTASFYGWLPLFLPELFPTAVRATGQGFGFNFGRILAAVGVLQIGNLMSLFRPYGWGMAQVCSLLSLIYIAGLVLIWFAPETKGKPLPQ
jgi:SHS family sialic acid transporter-like MFS transporter